MTGGEENFTGRCEMNDSEFSVSSASRVLAGESTSFEGPVAQVPPGGNGVYADGKPVAGADGGLVAISEYEDGVRFLQIQANGSIEEQGYFLSLGSSSSSPKWAGKDDVLYSIDYVRGIDILRWKGSHYVPGADAEPGTVPGTEGETPPVAPSVVQAAKRDALAAQLQQTGWSPGLCRLAAERS